MAQLQIPITKGKGSITVNTADVSEGGDLTEEVMREAIIQGLKVILNRGMSKITKETYPNEEEMKAAAMKKAEQTFKDMRENKIRFMGAKVKKEITGEVMTEAMRLARNLVKQGLKDAGVKLSHVKASEITRVAKDLLAEQPDLVTTAKENVAARKEAVASSGKIALAKDKLAALVDPTLKAKVEKEQAEKKAQLSANKAGKVAVRAKAPAPQATAH